jgi:hypothetical protein
VARLFNYRSVLPVIDRLKCTEAEVERLLPSAKAHPELRQKAAVLISEARTAQYVMETFEKIPNHRLLAGAAARELMKHLPILLERARESLDDVQGPDYWKQVDPQQEQTEAERQESIQLHRDKVERLNALIELLDAEFALTVRRQKGNLTLFSWHDYAPDLLDIYKKIVGSGGQQAGGPAVAFVIAALESAGWKKGITPTAVEQVVKRAKRSERQRWDK